jgi:hypothetical protein
MSVAKGKIEDALLKSLTKQYELKRQQAACAGNHFPALTLL